MVAACSRIIKSYDPKVNINKATDSGIQTFTHKMKMKSAGRSNRFIHQIEKFKSHIVINVREPCALA